jgi:hypothetical protein
MEKIRKTIRKQVFFDDLLSILTVFWSLLNFGSILAQKLNRFICKIFFLIFWHPGHPWSCESSGVGKIRALSDTVLKDSKLILNESKLFPWSSSISLVPFRTIRGPLIPKPVTGQKLFFAVSYSKPPLVNFSPLWQKLFKTLQNGAS